MKKVIALLMSIVLILTTLVVSFAEEPEADYDYDLYFNIGDSIARGCNLPSTLSEEGNSLYYNDVLNFSGEFMAEGSFPQIIKDSSVVKEMYGANLQCMGLRSVEAYYAIGGDVDLETYDDYYSKDFHYHVSDEGGINDWIDEFSDGAASADLITLEVGSNDIFYSAQVLSGLYGVGDVSLDTVMDFLKYSFKGLEGYKVYYPKIVERIFELQQAKKGTTDDVTIALVSCYNPFANCALTDEILIHIGEIFGVLTDQMNAVIKKTAEKYDQCYYVDISNVQTNVTRNNDNIMNILAVNASAYVHPDEYGNAWIADQILDTIPRSGNVPEKSKTDISMILPNNCTVTSVTVNTAIADFVQDGNRITISNNSLLSTFMTVYGKSEEGNDVFFVYGLNYDREEGYTARRLFGSINMQFIWERLINAIKSVFSSIQVN